MLLLLTNDDGVNSEGLWALIEEASKVDDLSIVAVAPDRERSACGHGISIHQPIEVHEVPSNRERVSVYATSGTPADCVKLAVEGMLKAPPDFLISGVNRGPNLGTDVFYSGTVSAALEGALLGVKSMAVSVTAFQDVSFEDAAAYAVSQALSALSDSRWPILVNVNVPAVSQDTIAGVSVTRLGVQAYQDVFTERLDPKGRTWYWLGGTLQEREDPKDSDTTAIRNNMISVTPLLTDLTDLKAMDSIKNSVLAWPS